MNRSVIAGIMLVGFSCVSLLRADELGDAPRWYISPGVGLMFPEGNQPIDEGLNMQLRLGYDLSEHWSVEGGASWAPNMTNNERWDQKGQPIWGLFADGLYHFDRYSRLDPYVSGGFGVYMARKDVFNEDGNSTVCGPRLGVGLMYHLTDNWSLRSDARVMMGLDRTYEMLWMLDAGVVYRFGGGVEAAKPSDGGSVAALSLPMEPDAFKDTKDIMLFELYIEFDYDTTIIKPEYFKEIDQIVRVLTLKPEAKALVEGHADRRKMSSEKYNQALSERRAQAVAAYMMSKGIASDRLMVVGYGFSRPKVTPDLVNGNPENRRVEVYIRGAGTNADKASYVAP